nr:MAG TPA: hypothetical protein [Caudoviricetes sp.]
MLYQQNYRCNVVLESIFIIERKQLVWLCYYIIERIYHSKRRVKS